LPLGPAQQDSGRQSGGRDGRQTDAGSPRPPNPGGIVSRVIYDRRGQM